MFKMTLLGLAVALGAILTGQVLEGASLALLFQPTALLIVFGGTLGAILVQSSPSDFKLAFRLLAWLRTSPVQEENVNIKEITAWARLAHRESALKLDGLTAGISDSLLRNGLEMVVDRFDPAYIRETMLMELKVRDSRMRSAIKVWESAAGYAPTIGILGSVMGLLHVMSNMQDAAAVGPGLAVSFVATFYGLGLANLVFLPVAGKLKGILFELTLRDEMRIEGLGMIAENKQPQLVEKTLRSFGAERSSGVPLRRVA